MILHTDLFISPVPVLCPQWFFGQIDFVKDNRYSDREIRDTRQIKLHINLFSRVFTKLAVYYGQLHRGENFTNNSGSS